MREWRYWPGVTLALLIALSAYGLSLSLESSSQPARQQSQPTSEQNRQADPIAAIRGIFVLIREFDADDWVALFTAALFISTVGLWWVTRETLKHAQESNERQLRAYVSGTPEYFFSFSETVAPRIRFRIVNHGQTPAHRLRNYSRIEIWPHPLPIEWDFGDPATLAAQSVSVLFPGSPKTSTGSGRLFAKEELEQAVEGVSRRFYINGVILYRDIFNVERRTRFCSSVARGPNLRRIYEGADVPEGGILFQATIDHNDAT